jgi:hypothetical protein
MGQLLRSTGLHKSIPATGQNTDKNLYVYHLAAGFVDILKLLTRIVNVELITCFVDQFTTPFELIEPTTQMLTKLSIAIAIRRFEQVFFP